MLKLQTIRKEFVDEEGAGVDAFYTIRKRLSYDAQQRYAAQLAGLDIDVSADADEKARVAAFNNLSPSDRQKLAEITSTLLGDALVRLEGVCWEDGSEVVKDRFGEFDSFYVNQVTTEIQTQNAQGKKDPNSERPSSD